VLHRAEPRWGCGRIPVASRVVETAGPGAGTGGLAAIEPVEPPGLIKGGDGHDKAGGGRPRR